MSKKTHYRIQLFEDTGFAETLCGIVVHDWDTDSPRKKVSCKNCIKKLEKLKNACQKTT